MDASYPVLVVAGPTASGKSSLAMDVAGAFAGTVINGDSMQVYRELRVLTARPSAEDERRVPHRLYGVLPAAEACSAGRWLEMARAEIAAAERAGRLPIVVGGSGLYLEALRDGLAAIPEIPEAVRAEARDLHRRLGGEAFRRRLGELDGEAAGRIEAGDGQRLVRAFEVVRATGRALSDWQGDPARPGPPPGARLEFLVLMPPREALYAAIDARFEAMVGGGALDEVAALENLGLDPGLPLLKALGMPELGRHLKGEITLAEARDKGRRASRNYAKRQLTWLRNRMAGAKVISAQYSESIRPVIFSFIRQFVLTGQT